MSDNNGNSVTNTQESYFRALTTTTVRIEAVDPNTQAPVTQAPAVNTPPATQASAAQAPAVNTPPATQASAAQAPVVNTPPATQASAAQAPVVNTPPATQASAAQAPAVNTPPATQAPAATPAPRNRLLEILLALVLIGIVVVIGLLLGGKLGTLPGSTTGAPADNSSAASVPASGNLVTQDWNAVLTSANSNGNFIGDFGGRGNGSMIPTEATDLGGKTWPVGRALLTYCETASNCFYMFANPGEVMPRAFNVNMYTPEFTGDLAKELQYVNTGWNNNADVTWTYWTNN